MNKSAKTAEHEEGDDNVLLDEGFSVVDDINTGLATSEGSPKKTNDEKKDVSSSKKQDNDDEKNKQTESKKEKSEVKSESSKSCSDGSTLILSNDVDLGTETPVSQAAKIKTEKVTESPQKTVAEKKETKEEESTQITPKKTPIRKKGTPSSYVWITNISNTVNASSLKKHFSDCGRVNTAKVVTNGKLFFGYVEFDSPKIAQKCVEKMNCTILGGKKILVSRSRPDVTKKTPNGQKKSLKNDQQIVKCKEEPEKKTEVENNVDLRKIINDKKESEKSNDKIPSEEKKKIDEGKKNTENKNKVAENEKKKPEEKQGEKRSRSGKEGEDLKLRMNETKKKLDSLRTDLERTQIEVRNLRRRLTTEQKKCKAEEMRAERYRQQMRKLTDEIKEAKLDFKKDVHRLTKKHKLEMEKAELDRDSLLKKENDLRRRQEDLNREFKKLEETKKSLEHLKRSRKSRSSSPPLKRFRGREAYPEMSPPPAPKLSGDVHKPLLDRPPSSYYEEKKSRGVYERLGDYTDKSFPKDSSNGRYRRTYPGESMAVSKNPWSSMPSESWKKNLPSTTPNFMKPYMERFGGEGYAAQPSPSTYYPPGTSEYPKHFDSSRKY